MYYVVKQSTLHGLSQRLTFFSHPGFEAFPQTAVSTLIALVLVNDTVS